MQVRNDLSQQLWAFAVEVWRHEGEPRHVTFGLSKAACKTSRDRITAKDVNHGNPQTEGADNRNRRTLRDNQIYRYLLQLGCQLRYALNGIVTVAKHDEEVTTLDKAEIGQAFTKSI